MIIVTMFDFLTEQLNITFSFRSYNRGHCRNNPALQKLLQKLLLNMKKELNLRAKISLVGLTPGVKI